MTLQTKKYAVKKKKMDDVSCATRIYKHFQFTFEKPQKNFYVHYNNRCLQHCNIGSCHSIVNTNTCTTSTSQVKIY